MADEQSKKTKRRVKNPETFRERALKSDTAQPKRLKRARGGLATAASRLFRPLGKLFATKPLQLLFKPFRLVGRILFPKYFRNSWKELKFVTWPNWEQSRQLTFAVLIFAVIFGGLIALLDLGLDKVFKQLLLK